MLVRGASQAAIIELVPAVGSGPGPQFVPDGAGDRFPIQLDCACAGLCGQDGRVESWRGLCLGVGCTI